MAKLLYGDHYSSVRTAAAILRTRSGSAIASISTILPSETVNPITANGRPATVTTTPAAPHKCGAQLRGRVGEHECLAGYGICATDHRRGRGALGAPVGAQHDIGIEQRNEGIEITAARSREEGIDHVSLTSEIGVRSR